MVQEYKEFVNPITANSLSSYAVGTAYSLTNAQAALVFGTTSPIVVFNRRGLYRVRFGVVLDYNGATFAAVRTATLKLRRTNNTAADLTSGSVAVKTEIITAISGTLQLVTWETDYLTPNIDDSVTIFGGLDTAPTAGSLDASQAFITAFRLQQ